MNNCLIIWGGGQIQVSAVVTGYPQVVLILSFVVHCGLLAPIPAPLGSGTMLSNYRSFMFLIRTILLSRALEILHLVPYLTNHSPQSPSNYEKMYFKNTNSYSSVSKNLSIKNNIPLNLLPLATSSNLPSVQIKPVVLLRRLTS
jgi:hypothetical protein